MQSVMAPQIPTNTGRRLGERIHLDDVFVAWRDGRIAGSVQLDHDTPANQPHRADVAKMQVHRMARRRGVGEALVRAIEEEARKRGVAVECGIARFRETSRGHIMGVESGILKLVFEISTRRLLGVHIIGEGATELVHIGQAVIELGGVIDYFIDNSFNYPTLAEGYKVAALDAWNRLRHREGAVIAFKGRARA